MPPRWGPFEIACVTAAILTTLAAAVIIVTLILHATAAAVDDAGNGPTPLVIAVLFMAAAVGIISLVVCYATRPTQGVV